MKFHLGVSNKGHTTKPKKITGITYHKTILTPQKLLDLILSGHVFTHNFKGLSTYYQKQKTKEYFEYTNIIFFDFDDCKYTFQEILNQLKIQPLIGYTTYSNSKNKNRFRLVYLIEEGIQLYDDYTFMCQLLLNILFNIDVLNDIQKNIDTRCFQATQLIFGSSIDCERVFNSNQIISVNYLNDLLDERNSNYEDFEKKYLKNTFGKNQSKLKSKTKSNSNTKCQVYSKSKELKNKNTILQYRKNQTVNVFAAKGILNKPSFRPIISNVWTAQLSDDVYTFVGNQNIYQLNTFFGESRKVQKGKRNNALFRYCAIIRNIYPEVSMEVVLANLMWFRKYYVELPREVSNSQLISIVEGVFKSDRDYSQIGKRKYLINPEYKYLPIEKKRKELGKARRKYRDECILYMYDTSLSVKENAEIIGFSSSTIYKSLKENEVEFKDDNEFKRFKKIYFSVDSKDRSIRKMMKHGFTKYKSEKFIRMIKSEK